MSVAFLLLAISIGWTAAFHSTPVGIADGENREGVRTVRFSAEEAVIIEAYGRDAAEIAPAKQTSGITEASVPASVAQTSRQARVTKAVRPQANWWTALAGTAD